MEKQENQTKARLRKGSEWIKNLWFNLLSFFTTTTRADFALRRGKNTFEKHTSYKAMLPRFCTCTCSGRRSYTYSRSRIRPDECGPKQKNISTHYQNKLRTREKTTFQRAVIVVVARAHARLVVEKDGYSSPRFSQSFVGIVGNSRLLPAVGEILREFLV